MIVLHLAVVVQYSSQIAPAVFLIPQLHITTISSVYQTVEVATTAIMSPIVAASVNRLVWSAVEQPTLPVQVAMEITTICRICVMQSVQADSSPVSTSARLV